MGGQLFSRLFNRTKFWTPMLLFFLLTAVAGATPAESFQDLMDKAKEAQLVGKTEHAADLYRAALRLQPHSRAAE